MGLLSFLFGSHPQQPNVATGPSGTQYPYDANGNIVAQQPQQMPPQAAPQQPAVAPGSLTQHLATVAPAAPLAAGAAPPPPPTMDPNGPPGVAPGAPPAQGDDITVTGDPWHPKKASVLGQIADYFLGTHFGRQTHRENMEGALQHLQSNPDEAIRRMAQFDPEEAEKLYQHVSTVKHYNAMIDREEGLTSMQQMKSFMPIAAGMMQRISTDPTGKPLAEIDPAAWQAARNRLMAIGQHFNLSPDQINDLVPETPDLNVAQSLAAGEFPVYRQATIAQKGDQFNRLMPVRQQNANANTTRANAAMIGARNGSMNAQTNSDRLDETITEDGIRNNQRQQEIDAKPKPMVVKMTKYGPMEITGNSAVLRRPDGTSLRYITTDGVNWVPTHQKPKGAK